ncbi:MAG TPA: FG-GAP-like repeat-containing protein [Ignavibacteriaceae bacterium]|nr:FG-GAP-like repeat-containing protein [Ignavibacteriaceae bacterium]
MPISTILSKTGILFNARKLNILHFIISVIIILPVNNYAQTFNLVTQGAIVNDGGWNYGCAWGDYDNDGNEDLFVVNNQSDNKNNFLYKNLGDGTFEKITEGPLVNDGGSSYGCSWGDYDNDGNIDLFVCNYNENNFLYRNNGDGTFTKITAGAIVSDGGSSTCPAWADYDNDGFLDLYVCNRTSANFLYHNNGNGTFTRILTGTIVTENKNSSACAWGDYDNDGYPDMYVANSGPADNSLFHNNQDGTFTQITGDPCVSDLEHFNSVTWADYDNDGCLDILTVPGILTYTSFDVYLYHNNGNGTFTRVTGLPHNGINTGGGSGMIDVDNDGDLDIFASAYDGNNLLLLNDGNGNFSQVTSGTLIANGNYNEGDSWADYDKDGDLDLFVAVNNYFGGNNRLFLNNGNSSSWLGVKCTGTGSNRMGIGAVLKATAVINGQQVSQTSVISTQTGGGTSSQNSIIAHFGFGDASTIDTISIDWPDGIQDKFYNVSVNQILSVQEGETVPVEIVSFTAAACEDGVVLNWQTATETNNKGFDVERRVNNSQLSAGWERIGFAGGVGTVIEPKTYSYTDKNIPDGNYSYRLKQIDFNGTYEYSKEAEVNVNNPVEFSLSQNYPNPFNPVTTIRYSIPEDGNIKLKVYNSLGQQEAELINGFVKAGSREVKFDGSGLASGVYFYKIESGNEVIIKKLMLLK